MQDYSYSTKTNLTYYGYDVAYIVLSTFLLVVALVNIGFAVYHFMYATKLMKEPIKIVERFQSGGSLLNFSANIAYKLVFSMGLLITSAVDMQGLGMLLGVPLIMVPMLAIIIGIMA